MQRVGHLSRNLEFGLGLRVRVMVIIRVRVRISRQQTHTHGGRVDSGKKLMSVATSSLCSDAGMLAEKSRLKREVFRLP